MQGIPHAYRINFKMMQESQINEYCQNYQVVIQIGTWFCGMGDAAERATSAVAISLSGNGLGYRTAKPRSQCLPPLKRSPEGYTL